jgi:hypothetical protein
VRLIDAPRARVLLALGYRDIYAAADAVMDVLPAQPIGLEAIDEVIVANLRKKVKLSKEVALLPDGEAWLLVELAGDTVDDARAAAEALRARLGRRRHAPAGRVFTDPREIHMVWLVRESGLGATAFVPGETATWEGWEDAAVAPEHLGGYLRDFRRLLDRYGYRCFAVFRDEARHLSGDRPIAGALSAQVVLFDEFVRPHFDRGDLPAVSREALVHVHCHQQALASREVTAAACAAAQLNARVLDAGCCGMAGSFGFDRKHYGVSMDIGERVLLPAVRQASADTLIVANGFSCREQIRHATGRRAEHFAEVVARAIGVTP